MKDFLTTMQSTPSIQSEIEKLRYDVEEYAKKFPTIGFEKETMKYKSWKRSHVWYEIIIEDNWIVVFFVSRKTLKVWKIINSYKIPKNKNYIFFLVLKS